MDNFPASNKILKQEAFLRGQNFFEITKTHKIANIYQDVINLQETCMPKKLKFIKDTQTSLIPDISSKCS